MSEENVEVAHRLYPGPLDLAPILADPETLAAVRATFEPLVHPDFETIADPRYQMLLGDPGANAPAGSERSVFHGIDAFIGTFREWLVAWESWLATPIRFIDVDQERVLVELEIQGRSKRHGVEMTIQGANLLTLKDGALARLELFFRRADALEAAGLSE